MAPAFAGFSPKAITFLRQLKKNNDRDWFRPRKAVFDELLRGPMLELAGLICEQLRTFAVGHVTEPKKAVRRIYRDTRFSKDKTPYKTGVAAMFPMAGIGMDAGAGFYFRVSPEGLQVGGGMFRPEPGELKFVRGVIAEDPLPLRKLLENRNVVKKFGPSRGETTVRVPKDFPAEHPAADLLRRKQFYFFDELETSVVTGPRLLDEIVDRFRSTAPLVAYMNALATRRLDLGAEERPLRPTPMF